MNRKLDIEQTKEVHKITFDNSRICRIFLWIISASATWCDFIYI